MVEWPFIAAVERHNNNSKAVTHAAVRRTYETQMSTCLMEQRSYWSGTRWRDPISARSRVEAAMIIRINSQ